MVLVHLPLKPIYVYRGSIMKTLKRNISDEKILQLAHSHIPVPQMNDEVFLEKLRSIIDHQRYVTTAMIADIYTLRAEFEGITDHTGKPKKYSPTSVRTQISTESPGRHPLKPISEEEQIAIFGTNIRRMHWFHLEDVLMRELGRWPYKIRTTGKKKTKNTRQKERKNEVHIGETKPEGMLSTREAISYLQEKHPEEVIRADLLAHWVIRQHIPHQAIQWGNIKKRFYTKQALDTIIIPRITTADEGWLSSTEAYIYLLGQYKVPVTQDTFMRWMLKKGVSYEKQTQGTRVRNVFHREVLDIFAAQHFTPLDKILPVSDTTITEQEGVVENDTFTPTSTTATTSTTSTTATTASNDLFALQLRINAMKDQE